MSEGSDLDLGEEAGNENRRVENKTSSTVFSNSNKNMKLCVWFLSKVIQVNRTV